MKHVKTFFLIVIFFLSIAEGFSQLTDDHYFQGFEEVAGGTTFGYHSPIPGVRTSLITRAQEGYEPIEWYTEVVPHSYSGDFVSFIWVYAIDAMASKPTFHLSVNGDRFFTFQSPAIAVLGTSKFQGKDGSSLVFNTTMIDVHEDAMGFATIRVPKSAIRPGEKTLLSIDAVPANSNAWIMTFQTGINEMLKIEQNKVVVKDSGELFHSVSFDIVHLGDDSDVIIEVGSIKTKDRLKAGHNRLEMMLPKVDTPTEFEAQIKIGNKNSISKAFTLSPVREWEIYFVQHTHTDAGYTRPQTEILPEHLRFIDHALDYCDETDHYPEAAQFRWTCETSWSIREYLKSRPKAQIDRLLKRIKEGRIEVTGMFFNFSEIIDESALAAQTKTLRMFKNLGIEVKTAMQNDVNGIAWCLVDYFSDSDVKYLTMGVHAHRARLPFDKPTSFWWQSPAGNRLLAYRSEHYMHGNALSLTLGKQEVLKTNLSNYLASIEEKGYPYNKISLQFSGYQTDNSPPSTKVCDIIEEWNNKYEWPKLRSALAKEFMIYLDEQHGDEIEQQQVAWPDWWTDGVGSAANETRVARLTHAEIGANTAVFSMAKVLGADLPTGVVQEIDQVYDQLLFYDEHTHGAAESISDPLAENTINQWGMKSSYAWDAAKRSSMLQEKALAFVEPFIDKSTIPMVAVFNTLNWPRSGMVELFIEYEMIPQNRDVLFTDPNGKEVPHQVFMRRSEGAYYGLWVEDLPPMGYKTIQVEVGKKSSVVETKSNQVFDNAFYEIKINQKEGVVLQIHDKELGLDLIDPDAAYALGTVIYEQLENRHALERLTASLRDTVYKPLNEKHTKMSNVEVVRTENGAIFQSLYLHGDLPVCADERGVEIEIRLYHHEKKIEFLYKMHKLPVHDPEGIYVAFPFALENGKLAFEAQGGVVYPGVNQLAGSASDWNTIQSFASVRNGSAQIVFGSNEIPLVQFGDLNIGRYYYRLSPKTNHIYSWVMNNYWVTNFKASQKGELEWSYFITSSKDHSDAYATQVGWGNKMPLLSRTISSEKNPSKPPVRSKSCILLDAPNLLLVNSTLSMDGKGIILHIREVEGDHAIIDIGKLMRETGAKSIQEVNVLEEEMSNLTSPLLLEHFETKFLKINFD